MYGDYCYGYDSQEKFLSKDAVYCNDRELYSELSYSTSDYFLFKSLERLVVNKVPTFNCTNISDAFLVNNTEAKLKYPISLMTADEIMIIGSEELNPSRIWVYKNSENKNITENEAWWTLTPYA